MATANVGGEGTARVALQAGSPQFLSFLEVRALVEGLVAAVSFYYVYMFGCLGGRHLDSCVALLSATSYIT